MRIPIRRQFMAPLLAVMIASLIAISLINATLSTRRAQVRIEEQLRRVVGVLATSTFPLTDGVLRQMGGLANTEFVLTDQNGRQIASSLTEKVDGVAAKGPTANRLNHVSLGPARLIGSTRYFHSSVWVDRRSQNADRAVLHILFPVNVYNAAWRTLFLPPLLVALATIGAVVGVSHLVASRIGREFGRLGDEVDRLAEGDFREIEPPTWDDEIRDLAIAVNRTAKRLSTYEAEIRRTERMQTVAMVGAGLGHEMRNAATGCRLAVDLHAEKCRSIESSESLDIAKRQLALIESRLGHFLTLGKDPSPGHSRILDLSLLVNDCVALVEPASRHAGVPMRWAPPAEPIHVRAEEELLRQALVNLLLNAVDATARGQARRETDGVTVQLRHANGDAELTVSDTGDGPVGGVADAIFEPFVSDKPEGIGLGLAVVKRAVEACGGRADWRRFENQTHFSIRVPRAKNGVAHV